MQPNSHWPTVHAYRHLSLLRFLSAERFMWVLDANAVEAAVIATADTWPDLDELVRQLFEHLRLLVIFSRQGAQDQALIGPWDPKLAARVCSQRLLFGSEYPVALWRDETYADTLAWINPVGMRPTAVERAAFDLPEELHRRVIGAYLARLGDASVGGYRAFIGQLLAEGTQAVKE